MQAPDVAVSRRLVAMTVEVVVFRLGISLAVLPISFKVNLAVLSPRMSLLMVDKILVLMVVLILGVGTGPTRGDPTTAISVEGVVVVLRIVSMVAMAMGVSIVLVVGLLLSGGRIRSIRRCFSRPSRRW
jgi:hypothetical protein